MNQDLTKINSALAVTEGFGAEGVTLRGETAASAIAARESAAIQARYIMAMRNPRNIEQFRVALLDECRRPGFAAVARFRKPVGKTKDPVTDEWKQLYAEGPSIRFIEAAIRNFKNISPEVFTVFDSEQMRIIRVQITDLEANICYATEIQIPKTVEKRGKKTKAGNIPPEGREVISERINSYGDPTYLVRATDDELLIRQAALISKSIRTQAQRLLPGDVVEECMDEVMRTQDSADAKDPKAAMRKLIDALHAFGVGPTDIEEWIGKPIEQLQPKEIQALRLIYISIKDGDLTWGEVMDQTESGSREAQQDVAERKLAALRTKAEIPQSETPKDNAPMIEEQRENAERKAALAADAGSTGTITFPRGKK